MATLNTTKWTAWYAATILLTECNGGKIKKLPFGFNAMIELKNVTSASDNTIALLSWIITCQIPSLWGIDCIFLSSILVLTTHGQFLDCATTAFSERFNPYFNPGDQLEGQSAVQEPMQHS